MLEKRIGFGSDEPIPLTLDAGLTIGTSGRTLPSFHHLATLKNLYYTVPKIAIEKEVFEETLAQLRTDAVKSALTSVLSQSVDYKQETDYDTTIESKIELFDEIIGYTMAIQAIEMMVSSNRKNDDERNINLTYSQLKMELEGVRNDNGHIISQGLKRELIFAIRKARLIIFPQVIIVTSEKVW